MLNEAPNATLFHRTFPNPLNFPDENCGYGVGYLLWEGDNITRKRRSVVDLIEDG